MKKILNAVKIALRKYDSDNIDVVREDGKYIVMYHSSCNSFAVSEPIYARVDTDKLAEKLDELDVGHCW